MSDPRDRLWCTGLGWLVMASLVVAVAYGSRPAWIFLFLAAIGWTVGLVVADIFAERRRVRAVTRRLERHCGIPCTRCHPAHTEDQE